MEFSVPVKYKGEAGLTMLASLATLDDTKSYPTLPEYAPYNPASDEAYLDFSIPPRSLAADGDTIYKGVVKIPYEMVGNGDAVVLFHTTAAGDNPTDFGSVTIYDDVSVTEMNLPILRQIIDIIESQRDDHAAVGKGSIYYVDPENGDTHANGNRGGRSDPYSTVQDCHDNAVTDYGHDVIFLVAGKTDGQTVLDEQVTITKNYVFIRGPGLGFLWKSTSNGDVLTVSGAGFEASGFELQTHTAGSGKGVVVTGEFIQLRDMVISNTRGDGITITDCSRAFIQNVRMYSTGQSGSGDGIAIDGTSSTTQLIEVVDCKIYDTQGDAISLAGSNVDNTIIARNVIHGSTGWGVNIGANVVGTFVVNNYLGNNTSGNIQDNGTNSDTERNEQWAKESSLTEAKGSGFVEATDSLEAIRDRGDAAWITGEDAGSGARTVTVTVDDGTDPLENATVRFTEGANTFSENTDSNGQVTFNLDDATYTVAIAKGGYSFGGTTETISADATPTYSMTQISISAPSSPLLSTLAITCYDEGGTVEEGVTIYAQMRTVPSGDTARAYDSRVISGTSNASGLVELTLVRNATYRIKRDSGDWQEFTPSAATETMDSFLGFD